MRSENARNPTKKHDEVKVTRYVQNGGLLELRSYLKRRKGKFDLNFRLDKSVKRYVMYAHLQYLINIFRTVLHIAALLGDDGIIRLLLANDADPRVSDSEGLLIINYNKLLYLTIV